VRAQGRKSPRDCAGRKVSRCIDQPAANGSGSQARARSPRTLSDDPQWKYANVRRLTTFLERSIQQGLQWTVFEPNGEALWNQVRHSIEDFLLNQWFTGSLVGAKPEQAFFVRCDRSTMTQDDITNGRLVIIVGVAPVRASEYVVISINCLNGNCK
jgi:phage tail sheath protein FI